MKSNFSLLLTNQYIKNSKKTTCEKDYLILANLYLHWQKSLHTGVNSQLVQSLLQISVGKRFKSVDFWKSLQLLEPLTQALILGTSSHIAEIDDSEFIGETHPSSVIFSALIPCLKSSISIQSLLKHANVGYQTIFSIGAQVNPEHYSRGWHGTSTVGTYGAYSAVASYLNLTKQQYLSGLSFCTNQISGVHSSFGTQIKPINAGNAARIGQLSAQLAKHNLVGNHDTFGCDYGFFQLYGSQKPIKDKILKNHSISLVKIKKYPACHCIHPFIEAMFKVLKHADEKDIKQIIVHGSPYAINMIDKDTPKTVFDAQFSLQFCLRVLVKFKKIELQHFSDEIVKNMSRSFNIKLKKKSSFQKMQAEIIIIKKSGQKINSNYLLTRK